MNKVIISGRLTRDPEVRYSQSVEPIAVVRFSVACNRKFKKENEPDADFINCVAFGKTGEIVSKYFTKGRMIGIIGSIRTNSWVDNTGVRRYSTDVHVDEVEFLEPKSATLENINSAPSQMNEMSDNFNDQFSKPDDFYSIEDSVDDDNLPF